MSRSSEAIAVEQFTQDQVLQLAASLEQGSEHPLADAILTEARQRDLPLSSVGGFDSVTGRGVRGTLEARSLALGNAALMGDVGAEIAPIQSAVDALRKQGASVMFLAVDGRLAGAVAVADPIKASTAEAIKRLRAAGLRVVMASGDATATAEAVARTLGIDEVQGEVRPSDKAALVARLKAEGRRVAMAGDGINDAPALAAGKVDAVKSLQQEGRVVAMVGDGINDAPALAAADVGIAMGTGTDIAMSSAQVTLVKGDLNGILRAREISESTVRNMKQNLWFAFLYNAFGVPIAAGVLYPVFGLLLSPMIAALAMSLSSVSVVTNALRLRTPAPAIPRGPAQLAGRIRRG